jgi:hypothetical protein
LRRFAPKARALTRSRPSSLTYGGVHSTR